MKQSYGSGLQPIFRRATQGFANVANHHIGAAYGGSAWTVPENKGRAPARQDIVPVGRVVARRPGAQVR